MDTKKYIADTFEHLLKSRNTTDITVDDIARECDISRSTFYRYYKDKYDLMNWIYQRELDRFNASLIGKNESMVIIKHLTEFILSKKEVYFKLFKDEGQNCFTDFLAEYSIRFTVSQLSFVYKKEIPSDTMNSVIIYCYGSAHFLKKWAVNGFIKTPAEIVHALSVNMPDILSHSLYGC